MDDSEIRKVEDSLDTLVTLLRIEHVKASPLITLDGDLEDINED
jgi:hypothetical protein